MATARTLFSLVTLLAIVFALAGSACDRDDGCEYDSIASGPDDLARDDAPSSGDDDDDNDDDDTSPEGTLFITPDAIVLEQNASQQFAAFILDEQGVDHPVEASWEVAPDAGTIDQAGAFVAGQTVGAFSAAITARFDGRSAFADATVTTPRDSFFWGFSHAVRPESIYIWSGASYEEKLDRMLGDFHQVGVGWYRPYIIWGDVDPLLEQPELSLDEITDDLVRAYAFEDEDKDWSKYDLLMDKMDTGGISLFLVIAAGFTWELPRVDDGTDATVAALPDTIGYDNYIAQACLHAKAAVARYKDTVGVWVTEAELNMAGPTVLWGWRDGEAWWDWNFTTALLQTLSDCVHDADPTARVTMNFHTDVLWKSHVRDWAPFLDIVSLDAFPNYFISDPVRGHVVGRRVVETLSLGIGKPVVIQETSYPTGVSYMDFSEGKQAQYIADAARAVYEAGGSGYFHFKLSAAEELGGGLWYHEAESRYGLVHTDDTYKPGFFAYRDVIDQLR